MLSWLPPILQPLWVDTVSRKHPFVIHTTWGACCFLSRSQWPTSLCQWKMLLSTELTQTGNRPLIHCYNASLARVPAATLRTGDSMSSVPLHFLSHLTYIPTCSLRAQVLCQAAGSSWDFLFLASKYVRSWFPNQGFKLHPLHWKCGVPTAGPPGKSSQLEFWQRPPATHKLALFYHPGHFLTSLCSLFLQVSFWTLTAPPFHQLLMGCSLFHLQQVSLALNFRTQGWVSIFLVQKTLWALWGN